MRVRSYAGWPIRLGEQAELHNLKVILQRKEALGK
jgi:hypothetical protein